jgi:transcriptional antiterminator RfaH
MQGLDQDWHVIKTARFKETYVRHQVLEIPGAEAYLPIVKLPKHCLKPAQSQFEPLFPGYVFARVDFAAHLLALRRLQAFHSIVCFDGKPACVEPNLVDDLRRRERGRGYINLHVRTEPFQVNQSVRVVEGAFSGQHGLFLRYLDSTQRVCILLDILKSGVRLELPLSAVAANTSARPELPQ